MINLLCAQCVDIFYIPNYEIAKTLQNEITSDFVANVLFVNGLAQFFFAKVSSMCHLCYCPYYKDKDQMTHATSGNDMMRISCFINYFPWKMDLNAVSTDKHKISHRTTRIYSSSAGGSRYEDFYATRCLGHGYVITTHRILWDVIIYPCTKFLFVAHRVTRYKFLHVLAMQWGISITLVLSDWITSLWDV